MTRLYTNKSLLALASIVSLTASISAIAQPVSRHSSKKKNPIQKISYKKPRKSISSATFKNRTQKPVLVSAISKSNTAVSSGNSVVPQSVAEAQTTTPPAKKLPVSLIDVSIFYGPSVTDISSSSTADDTVGSTTGLWSRHQMLGIYSLGKGWNLLPVFDFNYQFTDPLTGGQARGFTINDPNIRLQKIGILEGKVGTTKLALDGDIRYFIPVSRGSRLGDSFGSSRLTLTPSAVFGKSGLSFIMTNFVRGWAYQRSGFETASGSFVPHRTFQAYSGSQINYAINDNIQPFVLFEVSNNWYSDGKPEHSEEHNPQRSLADLEPGVNIQLNDRFSLTPFLNWYTNQKLKTTSANLTAVIQLF